MTKYIFAALILCATSSAFSITHDLSEDELYFYTGCVIEKLCSADRMSMIDQAIVNVKDRISAKHEISCDDDDSRRRMSELKADQFIQTVTKKIQETHGETCLQSAAL